MITLTAFSKTPSARRACNSEEEINSKTEGGKDVWVESLRHGLSAEFYVSAKLKSETHYRKLNKKVVQAVTS